MGGHKDYIRDLSQRSLDLGFEGLMIESHCNPSVALSDAKQQLTPEELKDMLHNQITVRDADSDAKEWKENIDQLRAKIDIIDESLLYTLASRMKISREIGEFKKNNNIAILQTGRWDSLLAKVVEKGQDYGLPKGFIEDVFNAIHEASVEMQNEVISGKTSEQL
jgi:chorismate mutase